MYQRIIIADDHAVVRDGLCRLLELSGCYRIEATVSSAEALLEACRTVLPDLIILDLEMPGMGGIEGLRRLLIKWPALKVTVFSIYHNTRLVKRVIEMGARGFITKSSESHIIVKGVKTVISGRRFVSPDIDIDLTAPSLDPISTLSSKEFDIFRCVAEGFSTQQISAKLFLSEKTIANNISIIKRKLGAVNSAELVHLAIREGLLLLDRYDL